MATTANGITNFHGNEDEDITVWLRDIQLIAKLGNLPDQDQLRVIVLKLRGKALSWASELIESLSWNITKDDFITALKKRFIKFHDTELSLSKFLTSSSPSTREGFSELLKTGTVLLEKNLMTLGALMQVLISKCPDTIKSLLFETAERTTDWQTFIQRAEQVAWIAFPDIMLNRVSFGEPPRTQPNKQNKSNTNGKSDLYCEYHGKCKHKSENCYILKKLKADGWTKQKSSRVNAIGEDEKTTENYEEEEYSMNKVDFIYSINSIHDFSNKFFVTANIFGQSVSCLIDTGADISIIHENFIPAGIKEIAYNGQIRSAFGSRMNITKN